MLLIIGIVLLIALKYFGIHPFTHISWWWMIFMVITSFVWFELLERIFGFNKKHARTEIESIRKERLKNTFDKRS